MLRSPIVDKKINPTSLSMQVALTEENNRNKFAVKDKDLAEGGKNKQHKNEDVKNISYPELLRKVDEVNAKLSLMGENILVLIQKNDNEVVLKIIDTRTHETITQMSPFEFYELAQNLRHQKLNLIDRDV